MSLPKIDAPTFVMDLHSINKSVPYRPFLVKEEKVLLMAMEGGDQRGILNATKQIISNCILDDKINVDKLPLFDLQLALLRIRAKSVGEEAIISLLHPDGKNSKDEECDGRTQGKIHINELKIEVNENHNKNIRVNDTITVQMKYPTISAFEGLDEGGVDEMYNMIVDCIDNIYSGDDVFSASEYSREDLNNFVGSLSSAQFGQLKEFFDTMPSLKHDVTFTCKKCGCEEKQTLQGIGDFFL